MTTIQGQLSRSRGGGSPMPDNTRSDMESRFGMDFSDVRLHNDSRANEMARGLNAQAFTSGRDIYFGAGRYSPGTPSGQRLMAHELTHVVQQSGSVLQRKLTKLQAGERCQGESRKGLRTGAQQEQLATARERPQELIIDRISRFRTASQQFPQQPFVQRKKIPYRQLKWDDFKGKAKKKSPHAAVTSSNFHDPEIRKVSPKAKSLKAVDTKEECGTGKKKGTMFTVNIAIDPTRINVKAYFSQEKSWAKAWTTDEKAREQRCKAGIVRKCKAAFVRLHKKVKKQKKKEIKACKKDNDKWRKKVVRESKKHLKECRKALKDGASSYWLRIGEEKISATSEKECKTVLMKQFSMLANKQWFYSREINGEKAKAGTRKECGNEFAKRYEELRRKSLTWDGKMAGEKATVTSKNACSKEFLEVCKSRMMPAASRELLKHEQVHFDITEVKARETGAKLRGLVAGFAKEVKACGSSKKALRKAKKALKKNVRQLVKAYKANVKDLKKTQKSYDDETKHGKRPLKQERWTKDIREKFEGP